MIGSTHMIECTVCQHLIPVMLFYSHLVNGQEYILDTVTCDNCRTVYKVLLTGEYQ